MTTKSYGNGTLSDSTGNSAGTGGIAAGTIGLQLVQSPQSWGAGGRSGIAARATGLQRVVRKARAWLKRANRRFPLKLGKARRSTFCPKLWDEIYVSDKGVVYSCCHEKPRPLGDLHEQTLKEICNNALIQEQRRRSLGGRLECYDDCTLLKKDEIVYEEKPLTIDYGDLKRIKILFGEGCNISCIMCTQNHRSRQSLDYDTLVRGIDLAPFESIELQGGEPLFIMAARQFFDYAAGQGKKVSFLTNGIIINDEWAEKIALHSAFVYFSLNAATKETHELINRGSRWEVVLRNIQRVRAARERLHTDLRIVGHMTLVPQNLEEIPLFIEKHQEFGFDAINFGYDLGVPEYLKSVMPAARKQALIAQIAAAVERVGGDRETSPLEGGRLNLLRLRLLGLA